MTQHMSISIRDDVYYDIKNIMLTEGRRNKSELIESLIRTGLQSRSKGMKNA